YLRFPTAAAASSRVGLRFVEVAGIAAAADEVGTAVSTSQEPGDDHLRLMGVREPTGRHARQSETERASRPERASASLPGGARAAPEGVPPGRLRRGTHPYPVAEPAPTAGRRGGGTPPRRAPAGAASVRR